MPEFLFKGKEFVRNHHLSVPQRPLEPDADKSVGTPRLDGNLIIHGDNLHALKSLLPMYAGQVNCIYIDPPYNTGNENWCYNDNVSSPLMQEWLLQNSVGVDDGLRHDKWCAMMWPRLMLLRELMTESGLIFISIDDNEQHHLRLMMDEIFGAGNFIAVLPTIMNLKGNQDQFAFAGTHEYTIVWAKDKEKCEIGKFELDEDELEQWHTDEYGLYKKGANLMRTGQDAPREKRPTLFFPLFISEHDGQLTVSVTYSTGSTELIPISNNQEMSWRWKKDKFEREPYNVIVKKSNGKYQLYKKQRPKLGDLPSKKPKTLFYKPEYSSGNGTEQLKQIFSDDNNSGTRNFFYPKPLTLIIDILTLGLPNNEGIILDSFAGSGTTAHAVLALNKADGGNRKFILVECEDYADRTTAERMRRVIHGVPTARQEQLRNGLGGEFTFCDLGEAIGIDKLLRGENLPSYEALASVLFRTATHEVIDIAKIDESKSYIGESDNYHVWLIYKPDLDFLKSNEAALTLDHAREIAASNQDGKRHLVFAAARFVSDKTLAGDYGDNPIPIDHQPLPWLLYKLPEGE